MTLPGTSERPQHELFLADWRLVDGGVVVYNYQAFCRCGWSMRFPCRDHDEANREYLAHYDGGQP